MSGRKPSVCLWILLASFCSAAAYPDEPHRNRILVYCSVAGEQSLDLLYLEPETGVLSKQLRLRTPGEPAALAVTSDSRFLFASMRSTGKLCSFRINPQSGALDAVSVVEAGEDPAQITVDGSGRYLLTAYYVAAKVSVHRIADDGSLSAEPVHEVSTLEKAHAIVPDPTNRFVYVPHTGPNAIFQFGFDSETGRLQPLRPDRIARPVNTGPRHLSWHPKLPMAYVGNEQGNSVTGYRMSSDGQLIPVSTVSTLPDDYKAANSTSEIQVHPSGRYLYVANRGHDSLAHVSVDVTGGGMKHIGNISTESVPRSFDIDPSGNWLLAAGEASGGLEVFRIEREAGGLHSVGVTAIGPKLWWVLCVRAPQFGR
jgi:6-phosphogluconolactonase